MNYPLVQYVHCRLQYIVYHLQASAAYETSTLYVHTYVSCVICICIILFLRHIVYNVRLYHTMYTEVSAAYSTLLITQVSITAYELSTCTVCTLYIAIHRYCTVSRLEGTVTSTVGREQLHCALNKCSLESEKVLPFLFCMKLQC